MVPLNITYLHVHCLQHSLFEHLNLYCLHALTLQHHRKDTQWQHHTHYQHQTVLTTLHAEKQI